MLIDKKKLEQAALAAIKSTLAEKWPAVARAVPLQVAMLAQAAAIIEDPNSNLNENDREILRQAQTDAVQSVLVAHKEIDLIVAKQAVNAAWEAIIEVVGEAIGK
jgi:hypothetical protein